jgi:hypothetical protein
VSIGNNTQATEKRSVAIGSSVLSEFQGSFVLGDSNEGNTDIINRKSFRKNRFYGYFAGG